MANVITRAQESLLAPPGTTSFVTGWGHTGTTFPTRLREVSVPIVGRDRCNSQQSYDGQVTSRMLCAGLRVGGKDSCQGDSGGPLMVMDKLRRFQTQAGIVSWGAGCALPDLYGVYSRLAVLEKWGREGRGRAGDGRLSRRHQARGHAIAGERCGGGAADLVAVNQRHLRAASGNGRAAWAGRLSRERSAEAGRRARRPAFGSAQLMR
jgi:hypothetical protein